MEGKEEGVRREIVVYRRTADGEENCKFLAPDVHQTGEKRRMCKKLQTKEIFGERERERERERESSKQSNGCWVRGNVVVGEDEVVD